MESSGVLRGAELLAGKATNRCARQESRETETRCLMLSPRLPLPSPAEPIVRGDGWPRLRGEPCSEEGGCEDGVTQVTQAPCAPLRSCLHLGLGSVADLWWLGGSRAQAAWLARPCHRYSSTSVPGARQVCQRSLVLGSECQHQTQWTFADRWVDSRYPEVRDSTQEVKAETEPLGERSQRQCRKQHAPGTALGKGPRWSAQALVQVGRGEEHIDSQTHSQEAPDQGGTDTSFPGSGVL